MEPETIRIEFSDGNWWDILKEAPYSLRRTTRRLMAPYMERNGEGVEVNWDKLDLSVMDEIEAARLRLCSVTWSWDGDITDESIETKTVAKVEQVAEKMAELYQEVETPDRDKKRTGKGVAARRSQRASS